MDSEFSASNVISNPGPKSFSGFKRYGIRPAGAPLHKFIYHFRTPGMSLTGRLLLTKSSSAQDGLWLEAGARLPVKLLCTLG